MPTPNTQLRRERQLRGWSQAYLAQQINVPDYYISRWERGDVFPSPYYQQKLCELFEKTAEELGMLQGRADVAVHAGQEAITDPFLSPQVSSPLLETAPMDKDERVAAPTPMPPSVTQSSGEQWPFPSPPSSLPSTLLPAETHPTTPQVSTLPKRKKRPLRVLISLIVLVIMLVVLALGGWQFSVTHSRSSTALPSSSAVGHLYFLSSGQVNDTSNQGIADQVELELHLSNPPAVGNSDYVWLLPDEEHPENPVFRLGTLTFHADEGSLSYHDPNHTNLLALTNRLRVTEENAAITPLSPSTDTHTWRYVAEIPHQVATGQTYSFLDHLRHLLSTDPKLQAHSLPGGLAPWLSRNVQATYAQALNAKETWQANPTASGARVRSYVTALLYYLDGGTYIQRDAPSPVPAASTLSLDTKAISIGLLQMQAEQDPPGYLDHITLHLSGLSAAPGATPALRQQITQIMTALNTVNAWLQQARQDAAKLAAMTDVQVQQPQVGTTLDDLVACMNNALVGQRDPVTGSIQQGAMWIAQAIEGLATVEIMPYNS